MPRSRSPERKPRRKRSPSSSSSESSGAARRRRKKRKDRKEREGGEGAKDGKDAKEKIPRRSRDDGGRDDRREDRDKRDSKSGGGRSDRRGRDEKKRSRSLSWSPPPALRRQMAEAKKQAEERAKGAAMKMFDGYRFVEVSQENEATLAKRRLMIQNLPPQINDVQLSAFLNAMLRECGATKPDEDALVTCWVSKETATDKKGITHPKPFKFAFVQMATVEAAATAIALNGISCMGNNIKIMYRAVEAIIGTSAGGMILPGLNVPGAPGSEIEGGAPPTFATETGYNLDRRHGWGAGRTRAWSPKRATGSGSNGSPGVFSIQRFPNACLHRPPMLRVDYGQAPGQADYGQGPGGPAYGQGNGQAPGGYGPGPGGQ